MSNLFKTVRIIHSPKEQKYIVQEKPIWSFIWKPQHEFYYSDIRRTSTHVVHDLAGDAYKKSQDYAEALLAKTVVWEKSNYFWN